MAGAGKDNIQVIKQYVPKFIREFKEKTNQPEPADINSKRAIIENNDDDNAALKDDEAPTICVSSKVTEDEAYTFTKEHYGDEAVRKNDANIKRKHEEKDDDSEKGGGKVLFKKPMKEKNEKKVKKGSTEMPKVKNSSLLSFGDDEEEEDY